MPTYEFRCPNGHEFDKFYKTMSTAPTEVPCPECGAVAARQLSGGGGLVFKGSGFYLTDYGKNAHRGGAPVKTGEGGKTESATGEAGKAEGGKAESGKGEGGKTEGGGGKAEGAKADSGSKSESKSDTAKPTSQSPQPKSEKPSKPKSE